MKLGFFEKVKIVSCNDFPAMVGRIGIVLGISEEEGKIYGYSVYFLEGDEGIIFTPEELQGTGEYVDRRLIYNDNDRIRVRVENGEGTIVE
jgi:hypothetical protein